MDKKRVTIGLQSGEKVTNGNAARPLVVHVPALSKSPRVVLEGGDMDLIKAEFEFPAPLKVGHFHSGERLFAHRAKKTAPAIDDVQRFEAFAVVGVGENTPMHVLPEEALNDFFNRDIKAADFIWRYGFFRFNSMTDAAPGHAQCEFSVAQFESERFRLVQLVNLSTLVKDGLLQDAEELAGKMGLEFSDDPSRAFSFEVASRLTGMTVVGSYPSGPLVRLSLELGPPERVVLKCKDVLTGLYALLLQAVVFGRSWKHCLHCATTFQAAGKKKYCTISCQRSAKQKRWRKQIGKRSAVRKNRKRV